MAHAAKHTYRLGIVGNCSFLAYVDDSAAVQWLCMPRFDSAPLFGGLVAGPAGGIFAVAGPDAVPVRQQYVGNTNVLQTDVAVAGGVVRVTDWAPRFVEHERQFRPFQLFRKLEPLQGEPVIRVQCQPAGCNGETPEVAVGSHHIRFLGLPHQARLTTDLPLTHILADNPFVLRGVQYLVFSYGAPLEAPLEATAERFLHQTEQYWASWIKSTSIGGLLQGAVIRSALVLKLHQFEDTGAIIASGTTSLPEAPGSERTWDYRYCWMRDSYYTVRAFAEIGHFDELERYFCFVHDIVARRPEHIAPLYNLAGQPVPREVLLDWPGYLGNRPVRIGNDACLQQQYDVYGQMIVAIAPLYLDRRLTTARRPPTTDLLHHLLALMDRDFAKPDAGIWEYRNRKQLHCYTYLFHWVGAKAALQIGKLRGDEPLRLLATDLEQRAAAMIEACWDPTVGRYGQAVGESAADASTLQLITLGYLRADSERARQHLASLEAELLAPGHLFYRYRHLDDFGAPETTFLATAFWRAEALVCVGRLQEAQEALLALRGYANALGLYSEDLGVDGSQWGNFPQTYSHVGLMTATARLAHRLDLPFFEDQPQ